MLFKPAPPVNSRQTAATVFAIMANRGRIAGDTQVNKTFAPELGRLVDELANGLDPTDLAALARLAEQMAKSFGVEPDEVAILTLTQGDKILKFLIPEKLQAIGTIPLNSTASLAARTAREKRAELVNNFVVARHASVFEGVPLGRSQGERIHKIMSAPIMVANKVVGVVQISRKGRTAGEAGPDFTPQNLRDLISLTGELGRFIQLCRVP